MTAKATLGSLWKWRWRLLAGVSVIAVLAAFGPTLLLGPVVAVEAAARRDIVQTVVAVGHVESRYRVDIGAQLTGVVASVPVEEGQAVKEGDLLILLDDKDLHAVVDQAEGALPPRSPASGRSSKVPCRPRRRPSARRKPTC